MSTAPISSDPRPQDESPPSTAGLRLGLSSGALFPDILTEDAPWVAAEAGFEDLEVMLQTPGEYGANCFQHLVSAAGDAGCRVRAVHVWGEFHPLISPYQRRVEEGRALFDRAIAGAATAGAGLIVWHGPRRIDVEASGDRARFFDLIAERAAACGAAGVRLTLENVSHGPLTSVREVTALTAAMPSLAPASHLGWTFDPFQASEAGANPFMLLAAMGDRVAHVHLSDRRAAEPGARHLPPGEGELPWPALLRAVAGVYAGPMIVEGIVGKDTARLVRSREWLAPLLHELRGPTGDAASDRCAGGLPAGVLEGVRLFNERAFYECHETIEQEWHAERGEIRQLYQGVLQIGVGFHHALNGNHRGALLLLRDGIEKTARFVPACGGLDTGRLVTESAACLHTLETLGAGRLGEFDPATIPTIHPLP